MIDDRFKQALAVVLKHEGGFVNKKEDAGGPTKYGVSLRFLKSSGIDIDMDGKTDINDINKITIDNVSEIYQKYFWNKYRYDEITNLPVAIKIFDLCVNMGPIQAHKIIQKAINEMMPFGINPLKVDGCLGSVTIKCINDFNNIGESESFLTSIKKQAKDFYNGIVEKNPALKMFLAGWLNRLND